MTVLFTDIVVVAVLKEGITENSAVIHLSKAGLHMYTDVGVRTSCRMLCFPACIPGSHGNQKITASVFHLCVPGHVASLCAEGSVKSDGAKLVLPGVGDQKTLSLIDQCVPGLLRLVERHLSRPADCFNLQSLFFHRHPFTVNVTCGGLYPYQSFKCVGSCLTVCQSKILIMT